MMENQKFERRYDLDWLRVIAILIVLLYHVGLIYCSSWWFHLKSENTSKIFNYIMIFAHNWRMPLLLFISGAATIYATRKRTLFQMYKERNKRLLVPLIFAMLVVVPPQIYYERILNYNGFWEFYKTVFEFVPYPKGGSFSWHHMWFVLYLLLYSVLALPLLAFFRKDKAGKIINKMDSYFNKKWSFLSGVIFLVISQIILRPFFPDETHALIDDWAYFVQYGSFYFMGLLVSICPGAWDNIEKNRKFHLKIGLVSSAIMWGLYGGLWGYVNQIIPNRWVEIIFDINLMVLGWTWVLILAGYGKMYLNKKSEFLKFSNEGIYPFYILHQTVIIAVGYYYLQNNSSILSGFIIISILSFIITVLLYLLFIRPFNITRFLFGMKPLKSDAIKGTEKISFETLSD